VAPDATATGVTEPGIAEPGLDSSGLPTVAAPSAPSPSTIPGISAPSETASLPPVGDGQVYGVAEDGSRVVLVARLESWIQVTDPETNALLTRVLRAGDRYYVPDQGGLTLATGNAGGLDIWVDGRKAPALGPVGVVRRGIALDPQRLENGTALPE
jgi:cytoskeleton protein RodZ